MDTRAEAITGFTQIDYYADTDTVDAYSETDVDLSLAGDYDAYVSLRVLDGNGFIIASGSAHDYYYDGIASVERVVVGTNPDTTYTAIGTHKAYSNQWDYYDEYPYYPYYYDDFRFSFFEGQGIWQPWWYYFSSPGFQQIRRSSPSITLGTTYDEKSVTTPAQKPGSLTVLSVGTLPTGSGNDDGCRTFNGVAQGDPAPNWIDIGPSRNSQTSRFTDANGQFVDAPYGACSGSPFTYTFRQDISIVLGSKRYVVKTNNVTVSSATFGGGSISNGSDIQKSRQ